MGKLVLHLPDGSTRDIALARERMTIGRRADNDICLPLPTVSAEHAAVITILDDSFLEDMRSRNGTLVNGRSITKHLLRDRDEIDIGRQRLVYFSGDYIAGDDEAEDSQRVPAPLPLPAYEANRPHERARVESAAAAKAAAPVALIDTAELFAPPSPPDAAPADAAAVASLEVLDGPQAGTRVSVDRDAFVLGRLGLQLAIIRRTPDGLRLALLEGDAAPSINGAPLPQEGALLGRDDEIVVAGVTLRVRPDAPAAAAPSGPVGPK